MSSARRTNNRNHYQPRRHYFPLALPLWEKGQGSWLHNNPLRLGGVIPLFKLFQQQIVQTIFFHRGKVVNREEVGVVHPAIGEGIQILQHAVV